jgi:hypothetical protein
MFLLQNSIQKNIVQAQFTITVGHALTLENINIQPLSLYLEFSLQFFS